MASVTILPRTGHMVCDTPPFRVGFSTDVFCGQAPQQSPEFVADAIYRILVNDALASRTPREKL